MNHKICETIKNLRISRSISQENFANELGVSAQAVSKWENHKALPDISLLPKIADYFHVTIDTLFKGIIQDENYWLDTEFGQNDFAGSKVFEGKWYFYFFMGQSDSSLY